MGREAPRALSAADAEELRNRPFAFLKRAAAMQPVVRVGGGRDAVLVVSCPDAAMAVLTRDRGVFRKTRGYRWASSFLGRSLAWSDGPQHRTRRRILAPSFSGPAIERYASTMAELADALQQSWHDDAHIDVLQAMLQLNLALVSRTLFGKDVGPASEDVISAVDRVDRLVHERLGAPRGVRKWMPSRASLSGRAAVRVLDRVVALLIQDAGHRPVRDLLSVLVQQRAQELRASGSSPRDEAVGLAIACQDTTPNALAWAIHCLMTKPELVAELQTEVDEVLAGRVPTASDSSRLPRALRVFKETLRLYPPVFMTLREATEATTLSGFPVPKGARVLLNIYGIHRSPRLFESPEEFRPGRWNKAFEAGLPRGAFLPFIEGPRRCLGSGYALMEGQMVLATLLQRVSFEPVSAHPIEPLGQVTLRPREPIIAAVRRRKPPS